VQRDLIIFSDDKERGYDCLSVSNDCDGYIRQLYLRILDGLSDLIVVRDIFGFANENICMPYATQMPQPYYVEVDTRLLQKFGSLKAFI
jgi:hypothetical protein